MGLELTAHALSCAPCPPCPPAPLPTSLVVQGSSQPKFPDETHGALLSSKTTSSTAGRLSPTTGRAEGCRETEGWVLKEIWPL